MQAKEPHVKVKVKRMNRTADKAARSVATTAWLSNPRSATADITAESVRRTARAVARPPKRRTLYTPITPRARKQANRKVGTTKPHGRGAVVVSQHPKHPFPKQKVISHGVVVRAQRRDRANALRARDNALTGLDAIGHPDPPGPFTHGASPLDALAYHHVGGFKTSPVAKGLRAAQNAIHHKIEGSNTPTAGFIPPAVGDPVQKIGRNLAKDLVDTPVNSAESTFLTGRALVKAAGGNTKELKAIGHQIKEHDPIALLAQGRVSDAGHEIANHPGNAALEVSGVKAVIGRSIGAGLRTAGKVGVKSAAKAGSTERAPLKLYGHVEGGPVLKRSYSRDSINKGLQKVHEAGQRSIGRDPNVARGRRQTRELHKSGNEEIALTEGMRRHDQAKADREVGTATKPAPKIAVRPSTKKRVRQFSTKGLTKHHVPAIALAVERVLRKPGTAVKDLRTYKAKLEQIDPKTLYKEGAALRAQLLKQIDGLLSNKEFVANPEPAFHAAQKVIDSEAKRTKALGDTHMLSTEEEAAKYVPYAVVHMKARPAEGRVPTPAYERHLTLKQVEAHAEKHVRRSERALQTAQRKEALARGGTQVRVAQADSRLLRTHPEYRKAASALSRAQKELTGARKAFGNAARNPKMYSEQELAQTLTRVRAAEKGHAVARANYTAVKSHLTDALNSDVGRAPVGSLKRLESRRADVHAAEQELIRAREGHAAARTARHESRVPKAERSHVPLLLDEHGKSLTVDQIKAHMKDNGNIGEPGFFSQRPGATGKSSHYTALLGRNMKRPGNYSSTRSGLSTAQGTHEANREALRAQGSHSANMAAAAKGFDRTVGHFTIRKPNDAHWRTHSEATNAANELSDKVGVPLVPLNVGRTKAIQNLLDSGHVDDTALRGLSQKVHDAFADNGHGEYVLVPELIRDKLLSSVRPRDNWERALQEYSRIFKGTVLTNSTRWLFGNVADVSLRSVMEGITPADVVRGHQAVSGMEHIYPSWMTKEQAAENADMMRERIGGNFVHAQEQMETYRAKGRVARLLPSRAVAKVWTTQKKVVYGANTTMERNANYGALGKHARQSVDRSLADIQSFFKFGEKGMHDFILGLHETANQVQAARFVERVYGRWGKMSPEAKRFLIHAPFLQWLKVATRYVYVTLPVHHPIKTGMLAALASATDEERKRLGFEIDPFKLAEGELKGYLQGGVRAGVEDKVIPIGHYLSTGILQDPAAIADFIIPQAKSAIDVWTSGVDFTGQQITNVDGSPLTTAQRIGLGFYIMGESTIPWLSQARRLQEHGQASRPTSTVFSPQTFKSGGDFGSALDKVFNPVHRNAPNYAKPRKKGSIKVRAVPQPGEFSAPSTGTTPGQFKSTPGGTQPGVFK